MTLEHLKAEAVLVASTIGIKWETLDNIAERHFFEQSLTRGNLLVPELEATYTKLASGGDVVNPYGTTSADTERYMAVVRRELIDGYILQELYNKYTTIESIIHAHEHYPRGGSISDPDQLNLF
jgi:hypothetical protein